MFPEIITAESKARSGTSQRGVRGVHACMHACICRQAGKSTTKRLSPPPVVEVHGGAVGVLRVHHAADAGRKEGHAAARASKRRKGGKGGKGEVQGWWVGAGEAYVQRRAYANLMQ